MVKRIGIILFFFLACFVMTTEAKVNIFKDAATAIKTKRNLRQSLDTLVGYGANDEAPLKERARAYSVATEVCQCMYKVENEKLYLKKSYDTTAFFNAILQMYEFSLRCDSLEQRTDAGVKGKFKYRKSGASLMRTHRTNLLNGGKWHANGKRYAEAFRFFDMYCSTDENALCSFRPDTLYTRVAYRATLCAQAEGNNAGVLQYVDTALTLGTNGVFLHKYKAAALDAMGDTAAWFAALEDGMRQYPRDTYFFATIMDHLRAQRKYDLAMAYAVEMNAKEPDITLYRYGRCLVNLDTEQWDKCIETADDVLAHDSLYADAWYNKGLSYVKRAIAFESTICLDLRDPQCKKDRAALKSLYNDARTAMERYRALAPDSKDRWAPPLYHIYLNLNMGREFGEIERILKR